MSVCEFCDSSDSVQHAVEDYDQRERELHVFWVCDDREGCQERAVTLRAQDLDQIESYSAALA